MTTLLGRIVLLALPCATLATGCSSMQRPREATLVDSQPQPRQGSAKRRARRGPEATAAAATTPARINHAPVVEVADPAIEHDGWLDRTRRHLDRVAREIKADLEFHDSEGLEAFSPDAVEQVNMLRSEMNGPADITR